MLVEIKTTAGIIEVNPAHVVKAVERLGKDEKLCVTFTLSSGEEHTTRKDMKLFKAELK